MLWRSQCEERVVDSLLFHCCFVETGFCPTHLNSTSYLKFVSRNYVQTMWCEMFKENTTKGVILIQCLLPNWYKTTTNPVVIPTALEYEALWPQISNAYASYSVKMKLSSATGRLLLGCMFLFLHLCKFFKPNVCSNNLIKFLYMCIS